MKEVDVACKERESDVISKSGNRKGGHFLPGLPCDVKVLITSRFTKRQKRINRSMQLLNDIAR